MFACKRTHGSQREAEEERKCDYPQDIHIYCRKGQVVGKKIPDDLQQGLHWGGRTIPLVLCYHLYKTKSSNKLLQKDPLGEVKGFALGFHWGGHTIPLVFCYHVFI